MAKNKARSDERRVESVRGGRALVQRDAKTGRILDVKTDPKRNEASSSKVMERSAKRYAELMKRLAKQ